MDSATNLARNTLLAVALALLCGSCSKPSEAPTNQDRTASATRKLSVTAGIAPVSYIVERIGGDLVDVHTLVPSGQSPHTYEPEPSDLVALERTRVLFRVGLPFEETLLGKLGDGKGGLRAVDLRQGIEMRSMEESGHHGHEHHDHDGLDPHTWLSPRNGQIMARTIADALAEVDPAHADQYDAQREVLHADLEAAHEEIREILEPYEGRSVLVFHPAYGYFLEAYGLKQIAVEVEGKEPSARELAALVAQARSVGARTVFTQPEYRSQSARAIAEAIGGELVVLDPLAKDYIANMKDMARAIAEALS